MGFSIRRACEEDLPEIFRLIKELARYEELSDQCDADEERLRRHLFGPEPYAEVVIAENAGRPVGFALYYHNYSTFLARPGIYLEDLFVDSTERRKGIGRALFLHVLQVAESRDCGRIEWMVLDWNKNALMFYQKNFGSKPVKDWTLHRLTRECFPKFESLAKKGE